ncbi:MAG: type IV pilus biogenesis/stability protein PilW [Pseudohongiellaceae bacterium]
MIKKMTGIKTRSAALDLMPALVLVLVPVLSSCITTTSGGFAVETSTERAVADYTRLAFAYYDNNDISAARRAINNGMQLDNRNSELHHISALIHQREGDMELAEESFRRAVRLQRNNSRARNNYAAFLFTQQRFAEAHRQLEIVTADTAYEGRAIAFENLGRSALSLERIAEAETAFQRALTLNPGLYVSSLELADIYISKQDWPTARRYFQQYIAASQRFFPLTPRALLAGIEIESQFANEELTAAYARTLETLHRDSPEYNEYKTRLMPAEPHSQTDIN